MCSSGQWLVKLGLRRQLTNEITFNFRTLFFWSRSLNHWPVLAVVKGTFTNYVEKILPLIDHQPAYSCWHFWRNFFTDIGENLHTFDISSMYHLPTSSFQRSWWTNQNSQRHEFTKDFFFFCTQGWRTDKFIKVRYLTRKKAKLDFFSSSSKVWNSNKNHRVQKVFLINIRDVYYQYFWDSTFDKTVLFIERKEYFTKYKILHLHG